MASGKKAARATGKRARGRAKAVCALAIAALALLLWGYMAAGGAVVHIRRTQVSLRDLPEAFDGTTILFITDFDVTGGASLARTKALIRQLKEIQPDMLLLGGDYASEGLLERLNRGDAAYAMDDASLLQRRELLAALGEFSPPLGKYAVAGREDLLPEEMKAAMGSAGITYLQDGVMRIEKGGSVLYLAGLADRSASTGGLAGLSAKFAKGDCVAVLTHSPDALAEIQTSEATDGGAWADLVLCGSTHGGQICLGEHTVLRLSQRQRQYIGGWYEESGVKMLVSQGLGCECVPLRLGSRAEVHVLTLKRGE